MTLGQDQNQSDTKREIPLPHDEQYDRHSQVATKKNREEPIQMTDKPRRPWSTISIDQAEPYPDGHYDLIRQKKQIPSGRASTII